MRRVLMASNYLYTCVKTCVLYQKRLNERHQVERVEELVSGGSPDISYMDNDKRSPLHAAAFVGNCDIVEILIEQVLNAGKKLSPT